MLIAIILIVIIVLKLVFRLDPSYKVTEDKSYQQSASAALLGNQVLDLCFYSFIVLFITRGQSFVAQRRV